MTATLIDGAAVARSVRAQVAQRCADYTARHGHPPGLAVLLVGDDPASTVYVRHKVTDSEAAGLRSLLERHPATLSEADLLARVHALNADPRVHGILVQLPLPPQIDPQRVVEAIDPAKDVDGFHVANAGALMVGRPGFLPCTPYGCMKLHRQPRAFRPARSDLRGRHAVVIGRSNTVGKPMAMLLLQRECDGHDLPQRHGGPGCADPAGRCRGRSRRSAEPGQGRHDQARRDRAGCRHEPRCAGASLCGDVDFAAVRVVAGFITPVPGGVGPMTRAMLLSNTLDAAERLAAG